MLFPSVLAYVFWFGFLFHKVAEYRSMSIMPLFRLVV
jgi:hypothetical protein